MTWEIILGSTVIAAICSGIVSFVIASKSNSLQYITNDRKEWREEVRNIAKNIYASKYKTTLAILTDLKVRINAFGKYPNNKDFLSDSHIWNMIDEIEKEENKTIFENQKRILIEYLSLLLKFDWERSKVEVKGNNNKIISYIFFMIAIIPTAISCYYGLKNGDSNLETNISLITFIILMMVLINWTIIENISDSIKSMRKTKEHIDTFAKFNICWGIGGTVLGVIMYQIVKILCNSSIINGLTGVVCILSYLMALLFTYSAQSTSALLRYNYVKAVEKLEKEYNDLKSQKVEQVEY